MDPGVHHIYLAVAVQQLLFGAAWWLASLTWPDTRRAAAHWVGHCGFSAVGLLLLINRTQFPIWLGIVVADALLVTALLLALRANELFFGLRPSTYWQLGCLVVTGTVLVVLAPGTPGQFWRAPLLLSLLAVLIISWSVRVHRPMRREFGHRVAWLVHGPSLALALALLVRAGWLVSLSQEQASQTDLVRQALVLGYVLLVGASALHFAHGGMLAVRQSRQLVRLSRRDALTGLLNRRAMDEALATEWQRRMRYGSEFTLLMLDLDHFKVVNDRHGHVRGDEALVAVARVLEQTLRPTDVAARIGGEEFLVMLPGIGAETGRLVAERLRGRVSRLVLGPRDQAFQVTLSIGVSGPQVGDESANAVLDRADHALYEAKRLGRNQTRMAYDTDQITEVVPAVDSQPFNVSGSAANANGH